MPPGQQLRDSSAWRAPPTENLRHCGHDLAPGLPDGYWLPAETVVLVGSFPRHPLTSKASPTPSCRLPRNLWNHPSAFPETSGTTPNHPSGRYSKKMLTLVHKCNVLIFVRTAGESWHARSGGLIEAGA